MMLVFTRKNMISPINTIFTHYIGTLSIAGLSYLPRTYHEFFRVKLCSIPEHNTYAWEQISYHSYAFGFMFRHAGVWMAVMLGVWRYIAVIHPLKERQYCNMKITRKFIYAGYIFTVLLSIEPYFAITIGPAVKLFDQDGCSTRNFTIGKNVTIYELQVPLEDYLIVYKLAVSAFVFVKTLPSVALGIISFRLINTLLEVRKHRKEMVIFSKRKNTYTCRMNQQITQQTDRTTKILLIILALFIAGEVPHGVFCILTVYYGPKFFWKYYYYAMEIFNSLTFVSEAFNFVVYYSMSHQFRSTFKTLFSNTSTSTITPQRSTQST